MPPANILVGIAATVWLTVALLGRSLIADLAQGGALSARQIDASIGWPLVVVIVLLACAWLCNLAGRGGWFLTIIATAALLWVVPYLGMTGGGV